MTYLEDAAVYTQMYGSLLEVVLLLLWVYYSSALVLLGAVVTHISVSASFPLSLHDRTSAPVGLVATCARLSHSRLFLAPSSVPDKIMKHSDHPAAHTNFTIFNGFDKDLLMLGGTVGVGG